MNSSPHYAAEVPEEHEADHSSVSLAVSTVILALRHKKNSARPSLWLPLVRWLWVWLLTLVLRTAVLPAPPSRQPRSLFPN